MGQSNSKDELLYQKVTEGDVTAIETLRSQGANLEWIDKKGKTPLIVACMDPRLYLVAKKLIEMGANLNAYRPGRHAGTPLHHAAKRGLDQTVTLLLSSRANPFVRNDDCLTPLDVARMKGHINVVRAIENHISIFSGEICEILFGPGFFEQLVPRRFSRKRSKKSWAVVYPCNLSNLRGPVKLELAVYSSLQDPQPSSVIALWKCNITEPKFHETDPAVIIFSESTKTRYKFLSAIEGDKHQLAQLYSACKGLPQDDVSSGATVNNHLEVSSNQNPAQRPAADATNGWGDDVSSGTTVNNRLEVSPNQNPAQRPAADTTNGWGDLTDTSTHSDLATSSRPQPSEASCNGWADEPEREGCNGWASSQSQQLSSQENATVSPSPSLNPSEPVSSAAPSAPPIPGDGFNDDSVHYPAVDLSPVDFTVPGETSDAGNKTDESCCVICWEAPVEGACIPCGHMAGCMSCLKEIKSKKGPCPVCRSKIDQVIKLYAV